MPGQSHFNITASEARPLLLNGAADAMQKCFTTEEGIKKAFWHASQILDVGSSIEMLSPRSSGGRVHLHQEAADVRSKEPIHLSFGIYYSSLVGWLFFQCRAQGPENAGSAESALRRGIVLLSRSNSHVARIHKQALEPLQQM